MQTKHGYVYNAKFNARNSRNDDSDEDDGDDKPGMSLIQLNKKPYKEYFQAFSAQHLHYYFSEPIGAPAEYTDMIYRITMAGPQDVVYIHLNTPGGQLDTGVQIVNAIQNTSAKVVTILEGSAYSLGTLIFLAGDEMVVNDNCMMMFHNFNGGLIGKGNELVSELEATIKWFGALAHDLYIPFLSEEEFGRIIKGEDMWMQSPEIRARLEAMVAKMTAEAEAAAAEEEASIKAIEKVINDHFDEEGNPKVAKVTKRASPSKRTPKAPARKKRVEGTE